MFHGVKLFRYVLFLHTSHIRYLYTETVFQRSCVDPSVYSPVCGLHVFQKLANWLLLRLCFLTVRSQTLISNGRDCTQFDNLVIWGLGRGLTTGSQAGKHRLCVPSSEPGEAHMPGPNHTTPGLPRGRNGSSPGPL